MNIKSGLWNYAVRRKSWCCLALAMISYDALADLTDLKGQFSNGIEEQAAVATQQIYNQLLAQGCNDQQNGPTSSCDGGVFQVWSNVREVVHNANALSGSGPTTFSLGRPTVALLGRALHWCSGEEFASMGSLSSSFVSGQLGNLAARITALRFGVGGFRIADSTSPAGMPALAYLPTRGGAAGADDIDSRWGGFINGNFSSGNKTATTQEDAFDFKGPALSAGMDYRVGDHWVIGAMLGYQQQTLTFDTIATVEANSKMKGASILPYALYQSDHWYLSVSAGYQRMQFDSRRRINYASGALATTPVQHNTFADSTVHATGFSGYGTLGYSFHPAPAWAIEPSLSLNYQNVAIDSFSEQDLNNDGFNFEVAKQTVDSLEAVPALHIQYTFTPRSFVWVPFVEAQWHRQFRTDPRSIDATYVDAQNVLSSAAHFSMSTDPQDKSYQVYAAGLSAVSRGGLQLYLTYRRYQGMDNYTQATTAAGLRYEF